MKTILCVDDDPTQLMLLRLALTRANYKVLEAVNGQEGVDLALKHQPDLIIMDLMMPIMDGAVAVQHIKQNAKTKDTPVLILSAYARGEQAKRALEAGAAEMISKTFILTDLVDKIKGYFKD